MDDPSHCAVLVPVSGAIEPETDTALRVLAGLGYTVRTMRGGSQIDLARSQMATEALRDGFRETMWIDADTAFDPDDVERLRSHNLPLCAGLYLKKDCSGFAAQFRREGTVHMGALGGLIAMQYVGTGFLHVRREVYEDVRTAHQLRECQGGYGGRRGVVPYFLPFLQVNPLTAEQTYLSEDYAFCERVRQAGHPILADTRLRLGHIGRRAYTWDDLVPRERLDMLELRIGQSAEAEPPTPAEDQSVEKLYAMIGQKQARIEELDAAYDQLLNVFAKVVSGEVERSRVLVNLTDRSWTLAPEGQTPGMPAQFNGVPVCVVSPPPAAEQTSVPGPRRD